MSTVPKAPGRRGRWAWRCAIVAGAATLGALSGHERTPPSFAGGLQSPSRTSNLRLRAVEDGVQKVVTDVLDTPSRLTKQAKATVDQTLEGMQTDDGRALDTESPAGSVGAIAVSLAILPYIPISLYSTYLLATTGKGVPAGPSGLFGLAEGLSTLVIFAVVLWCIASFFTRGARGLPAGPFGVLGLTQSLSFLSAFALVATSFLRGSSPPSPGGAKTVKPPEMPAISMPKAPDMPKVELPKLEAPKLNLPKVDMPKVDLPKTPDLSGLGKDSSSFISNLQKGINEKVEKAKDAVEAKVEKAKESVESAVDTPKVAVPKVEVPKVEVPKVELPKAPKFDLSGFQKGISEKVEKAKDAVENAVEKVGDKVEDLGEKVAPPKPAEPPAPKPEAKAPPAPKPEPKKAEAPPPPKPKEPEPKKSLLSEIDIEDLF